MAECFQPVLKKWITKLISDMITDTSLVYVTGAPGSGQDRKGSRGINYE